MRKMDLSLHVANTLGKVVRCEVLRTCGSSNRTLFLYTRSMVIILIQYYTVSFPKKLRICMKFTSKYVSTIYIVVQYGTGVYYTTSLLYVPLPDLLALESSLGGPLPLDISNAPRKRKGGLRSEVDWPACR